MRRRRARALPGAIAALVIGVLGANAPHGVAAAPPDSDGNAELAAAQLTVHLLTHTELRPTDVTCTARPTTPQVSDDLLCFALVTTETGRETVAAVATLTGPNTYTFTAVTKTSAAAPAAPPPADPDAPESSAAADQAVLDLLGEVTSDPEGLQGALAADEPAIVSVDDLAYHEPTLTLMVTISSSVATPGERDELAWYITDRVALLWEEDQPLRAAAATIHPRLEVTVDGVIYGTPYDVMVDVADFAIEFEEWLAISTTGMPPQLGSSPRYAA